MNVEEQIVTKRDLAAEYKVTLRTVTNWMVQGRVSYTKIGRLVRFHLPTVRAELQAAGYVKAGAG